MFGAWGCLAASYRYSQFELDFKIHITMSGVLLSWAYSKSITLIQLPSEMLVSPPFQYQKMPHFNIKNATLPFSHVPRKTYVFSKTNCRYATRQRLRNRNCSNSGTDVKARCSEGTLAQAQRLFCAFSFSWGSGGDAGKRFWCTSRGQLFVSLTTGELAITLNLNWNTIRLFTTSSENPENDTSLYSLLLAQLDPA